METVVSYFATFAAGLLSGYLLLVLQDRRHSRKILSSEVYTPLHKHLFEADSWVERKRCFFPDFKLSLWGELKAAARTKDIKKSLHEKLEKLYEQTLPEYEGAWHLARRRFEGILRNWDTERGFYATGGFTVVDPPWWEMLTEEQFRSPGIKLQEPQALRFLDRCLPWHLFPDGNPDQYLSERFAEVHNEEAFERFNVCRVKARREIAEVLQALKKEIRT